MGFFSCWWLAGAINNFSSPDLWAIEPGWSGLELAGDQGNKDESSYRWEPVVLLQKLVFAVLLSVLVLSVLCLTSVLMEMLKQTKHFRYLHSQSIEDVTSLSQIKLCQATRAAVKKSYILGTSWHVYHYLVLQRRGCLPHWCHWMTCCTCGFCEETTGSSYPLLKRELIAAWIQFLLLASCISNK